MVNNHHCEWVWAHNHYGVAFLLPHSAECGVGRSLLGITQRGGGREAGPAYPVNVDFSFVLVEVAVLPLFFRDSDKSALSCIV